MLFKTFGKKPFGRDLEKIQQSPLYKNGAFQNPVPTRQMEEGVSIFKISMAFFNKPKNTEPPSPVPSVKTDLKNLPSGKPVIVWFGHSSYLIKADNKNILIDPVFSGHASPFSFSVKAFKGSNVYSTDDLPEIDVLILTHDHYDHLDYKTVLQLKTKVRHIYTSLGVGSHLRYWGFDEKNITEFAWGDTHALPDGMELSAVPARHFSGRGFTRAKTLWSAFVLKTKEHRFFIGADSGYAKHFKEIGEKHGPFDIVMLETGQYNDWWPYIHMKPEETVQAALDLKAKVLFPVHWGKFALAFHPWNEPIERLVKKAAELGMKTTSPRIGEPVIIDDKYPSSAWWRDLR
ncbi:MAG: putative Zn-dependent hydrolase of beta-lactamase fold protein [Bacteroidetes bacterium]|jgi:L-ascorbate metabolism protein UlaG (beta-lactamase superfamily)|nr:putative Zn-dependent hydrolase of beta-lactamase fold protein [Bacteroidota bacterium]